MKKVTILQELIRIAEQCGAVTDVGLYETWLTVSAIADDGTKVRFDVNFIKEEENDGN